MARATRQARSRQALGWLLRALGVGLVVFVLMDKVHWHDRVTPSADPTLVGEITTIDAGVVELRDEAGTTHQIARGTAESGPAVRVAFGMRALAERLARSPGLVAAILLGLIMLVVITGWRWYGLTRTVALPLRASQAVRLTFVGGFFNQAVPGSTGGDVVKAFYAARSTGAGTRSVLSVLVDRLVGLLGLVLLGAIVLFVSPPGPELQSARWLVGCVLGIGLLLGMVLVVRPVRRAFRVGRLLDRLPFQTVLAELRASLRLYRGHPRGLVTALGLSLVNHAGIALAVAGFAHAMEIEGATLARCLAIVPVANLLSAIPLLPGGWGVGEWAFATFFAPLGVPATEAVALSVVYRLAVLGVNLPGGLLWMSWRKPASSDKIRAEVEAVSARIASDTSAASD